jgi:hypothetical protein
LTLVISFVWLLRDVELKYFLMLFGIGVAVNVLAESFMSPLNTPDIVDAIYGIVGVAVAAFVTLSIWLFGLAERIGGHGAHDRD